ncbi:MAG: PcfJ domain-containing protein, partial [Ignavibacteriaceae bacterium]|nr:PcfJ domain-containing protein [Ignavibacteriaceae bacterium]
NDLFVSELAEDQHYLVRASALSEMHQASQKWKVKFPEIKTTTEFDGIKNSFNKKVISKREKLEQFPPPPIEDNEYVKALTTKVQLDSWSRRQNNCAHTYSGKIKKGQCYIYKVIYKDEEATLEVVNDTKGRFVPSQFSGFSNCKVSAKLIKIADEWIKSNRRKKKS